MNFEPSDQGTTMLKSNFDKLANDSWALSEWLSGRLICGKCADMDLKGIGSLTTGRKHVLEEGGWFW